MGVPARTLAATVERMLKTLAAKIAHRAKAAIEMIVEGFDLFIRDSPLR
jgi:hypothetical protein